MDIKDFKFCITNKETGESTVLTFNDLFGYEGEECGIFICYDKDNMDKSHIPKSFQGEALNYNSGYGYNGLNEKWDIEYVLCKSNEVDGLIDEFIKENMKNEER